MNPDARWKQNFKSYEEGLLLLRQVLIQLKDEPAASPEHTVLRNQLMVKAFESTFRVARITLTAYLEYLGVAIEPATPRNVIKEALAAGIITNGQLWIDMLEHRYRMEHMHTVTIWDQEVTDIANRYLPALDQIYAFLKPMSA